VQRSSPNFNKLFALFAALYDVIFSKLTKMGRLIPGAGCTFEDIFKEKIPGTEQHPISEELITNLSWLIYVAAFKLSCFGKVFRSGFCPGPFTLCVN
jgi:hypothetical protein